MKTYKIANDFQNLVKIDFQADADMGVLTLAELKAITGVIEMVENTARTYDTRELVNVIGSVNPKMSDGVLQIRIPRAVVDSWFENRAIILTRRWDNDGANLFRSGNWTITEDKM